MQRNQRKVGLDLRVPNIGNNHSNGDEHTAAGKLSDTAF